MRARWCVLQLTLSEIAVPTMPGGVTHLTADFIGVPALRLRDVELMSVLLIAAAGAAGLNAMGTPIVRRHPSGGLSAVLPLEGWQMSMHTLPEQELALLDILTSSPRDPQKALDVFTRRLTAREVRVERRTRGG